MSEWEKAGFTLIAKLSRYGNGIYVRIPKGIVEAFALRAGDSLKVEVKEFHRMMKPMQSEKANQ